MSWEGAWLTSRLVRPVGSMSSRSATVMKQLRSAWNQNFAPPPRLSDARIEMLDGFEVAGRAGLGGEHPAARLPCELLPFGEPALQDGGELAGDRELQRLAAHGVVVAHGHGRHVDLRPRERNHLGEAHAGIEVEAEGVTRHRVAHRGLEAPVPAWQHLGRRLDAAATRAVQRGSRSGNAWSAKGIEFGCNGHH